MKLFRASLFLLIFFVFSSLPVCAGQHDLRILYMNDFHGFADPYQPFGSDEMLGGIAYLAGRVEQLRKEKPSVLLAAGDMLRGNSWANFSQGASVIELMNALGFDAMVAGNHEFDFGQDVLRERATEAVFPMLGANVSGAEMLRPYVIIEAGGVKIAVIGIVTEDTAVTTHPRNVRGLKFESAADTAERYVRELKGKADILIILSHIGHQADRALAKRLKGIDIIVGGHSHTKLMTPVIVNGTIVVQAWEHAKALGVLDITVEDGKILRSEGRLEENRPLPGREDGRIAKIIEKYHGKVSALLDEKIGLALSDLDGENVRARETNLGNLVADIMRAASGADAAIINGGSIRKSIKKGNVKVGDIYSVLPFDNYIVAAVLSGKQIREALEHGVSKVELGEGRFPQVSGLSFTYDRTRPAWSRVTEVLVAGKRIDESRGYSVATNDFLAAGGDGYEVFADVIKESAGSGVSGGEIKGEKVIFSDSGKWLRDVVMEYIRQEKTVSPSVEGRIREVR